MNLLKTIGSIFSRKSPDESPMETPASAVSEKLQDQASSMDADAPPPSVVYIHSHGFTNGVFQIEPDKDSFERFLESCNQSDRIKERQALNKIRISGLEDKLNKAKLANVADREIVIEKQRMAGNLSVSIGELEEDRLKIQQKETELIERRNDTIAEYPWVPSLLFLSAAITFIAADISITKQITSWGFNMTGRQGWIYAVGLAFTAFLIKPTIDRMLEKPFQAGGFKLKMLYKGVLIGITILGLTMLWFLGEFRSDSERARSKLDGLSKKMAVVAPLSQQYLLLQNQYDDIQKALDENVMGQNGLVLSGLLFAIGGAICLSISFGSLKHLINRYWILPVRIGRQKVKIRVLQEGIMRVRMEHTHIATDQEKAEKRLAVSEMNQLQEVLVTLRNDEISLVDEFYHAQYEREHALYQDGRNRGEKYTLDGELLYKVSDGDRPSLYTGKQTGSNDTPSSSNQRPYTRRPFVKMRKMIADNFNKSKNNQPYDDGTEFEIVS